MTVSPKAFYSRISHYQSYEAWKEHGYCDDKMGWRKMAIPGWSPDLAMAEAAVGNPKIMAMKRSIPLLSNSSKASLAM